MKGIALTVLAAVASVACAAGVAAQRVPAAVIVIVDTDRVYRECTACKAAQTQLQGLVTAARARAQALNDPLQTEAAAIEQAGAALRSQSGAARTSAETALNTRVQAYQARQTGAQQEIARLEQNVQSTQQNVLRQINDRLNPIITQVMNSKSAHIALDTNATLARSGALDVTADVLAALNTALPSVQVAPLAQGQSPAQARPQGQ